MYMPRVCGLCALLALARRVRLMAWLFRAILYVVLYVVYSVVLSVVFSVQSEWAGVRKPLPGTCDSAAHPTVNSHILAVIMSFYDMHVRSVL